MAKTRTIPKPTSNGSSTRKKNRSRRNNTTTTSSHQISPESLCLQASELFYQFQIEQSLPLAQQSLHRFQETNPNDDTAACPALLLLGQIYLALGDVETSRTHYLKVTDIDVDGRRAGAAAFLWSAQLSEEGGEGSIRWFEKGVEVLRREIADLEENLGKDGEEGKLDCEIEDMRRQLGEALCSMAEVYMTDLSFDSTAGSRCNTLITEALLVSPNSPSVLQTLASIRISDQRIDDAKIALSRSMELWMKTDPVTESDNAKTDGSSHHDIPDFATRISLTRLLLEVDMHTEAIKIVDQLVLEDDESVEAWYLGGWSRFLRCESEHRNANDNSSAAEARRWFRRCVDLYAAVGYEDDRLRAHAGEVLKKLDQLLGEGMVGSCNGEGKARQDDEDEWEDEDDEEDGDDGKEIEGGDIEIEDELQDMNMN